jgi:hypothetical protein
MFIISRFGAQGLYLCWAQPCVLKTSKKQFLNFCRAKTVHPAESSKLVSKAVSEHHWIVCIDTEWDTSIIVFPDWMLA